MKRDSLTYTHIIKGDIRNLDRPDKCIHDEHYEPTLINLLLSETEESVKWFLLFLHWKIASLTFLSRIGVRKGGYVS